MTANAAMTKVIAIAVPEHGRPDRDSVARNLRRQWKRKHGSIPKASRSQQERFIYPGLGVLYDTLKAKSEAITHELRLPLSKERIEQLTQAGRAMREALERRQEELRSLSAVDCEEQVRKVIDVEGVDPVALVAEELKVIKEAIDDLDLTFFVAHIYI